MFTPIPEIEAQVRELETAGITDLRDRWRKLFKKEPPAGPDLLRPQPGLSDPGGRLWEPVRRNPARAQPPHKADREGRERDDQITTPHQPGAVLEFDGTVHPKCPSLLRPIRAGALLRTGPRQGRGSRHSNNFVTGTKHRFACTRSTIYYPCCKSN